jgi:hypothetical protein
MFSAPVLSYFVILSFMLLMGPLFCMSGPAQTLFFADGPIILHRWPGTDVTL